MSPWDVSRRPRIQLPPVTWREGVHLTATPIWCDARRRRDVCFVSSAERVGRAGHGQLVGTPITLALLGAHAGGHLAVPVHRRFTLGTLRLELIPSGRGLGAAALHVDLGGRKVLYAGPVRTAGTAGAEVRACDAVVVAAPYGDPARRFEPIEVVAERLAAWVRDQLAARRVPVLAVDSVIDGLDIAAHLVAAGIEVAGSRAMRGAVERLAEVAGVPAITSPSPRPCAIVRVESERMRIAPDRACGALVSGRALAMAGAAVPGFEAAFAWPSATDHAQLLGWIEQTSARDVFVTGAGAEEIVAALGPRARRLGPPHQMVLFPREAAR